MFFYSIIYGPDQLLRHDIYLGVESSIFLLPTRALLRYYAITRKYIITFYCISFIKSLLFVVQESLVKKNNALNLLRVKLHVLNHVHEGVV